MDNEDAVRSLESLWEHRKLQGVLFTSLFPNQPEERGYCERAPAEGRKIERGLSTGEAEMRRWSCEDSTFIFLV